jgi:hypothetical protein
MRQTFTVVEEYIEPHAWAGAERGGVTQKDGREMGVSEIPTPRSTNALHLA